MQQNNNDNNIQSDTQLTCKNCGKPRKSGRRLCVQCHTKQKYNIFKRNKKETFCRQCWKDIVYWRKGQTLCRRCYLAKVKKTKK